MSDDQYAVVLDESIDAILLRDLCTKEADQLEKQADKQVERASYGSGSGKTRSLDNAAWKYQQASRLRIYAERFEHVRKQEVEKINEMLGL